MPATITPSQFDQVGDPASTINHYFLFSEPSSGFILP
jgi:hypothetical protein